jgi:hypothetical protein
LKLTNLGRSISQEHFPNVLIVFVSIITIASGSVYSVLSGEVITFAVIFGFALGVAVFLCWAISREIDPDNDYSAFVQMPLTIWGMLYYGIPNIFAILFILHLMRIVTRSSGLHATWFESIVWFLFGSTLLYLGDYVAGLAMAAAFLLDGFLKEPLKRHRYFGAAALILTIVWTFVDGKVVFLENIAAWELICAGIITFAFILVIMGSSDPVSLLDTEDEKFDGRRIQSAQILLLLTTIGYMVFVGHEGLKLTYPLWTVLIGLTGYWYYKKVKKINLLK